MQNIKSWSTWSLIFISIALGALLKVYLYQSQSEPLPIALSEQTIETDPSHATAIFDKTLLVESGQTIAGILADQGILPEQCHAAAEALQEKFDPRNLKSGQDIFIRCKVMPDASIQLLRLMIRPSFDHEVLVSLNERGGYGSSIIKRQMNFELKTISGSITSSLYADSRKANIPAGVIFELTEGLSYGVHLQQALKTDDPFEVMYQSIYDPETGKEHAGKLVYAAIGINGTPHEIFRFQTLDGRDAFYNQHGESVKRALLATPIVAARLSSGFGMRKHPIQGYSRMHKGVDFAAPRGTHIMAAGDGIVTFSGRKGGYGNYIKLNHSGGYSTVYAHLSRFAPQTKRGARVKQGQIIGFVGSTGSSTGPHLHHEVLINGKHVDPQKIKQPPNIILTGADKENFNRFIKTIKRKAGGLRFKNQYALNNTLSSINSENT
jgi:murein DD-endopeptidase MepM/ murein hydrolase activator NlpD